LRRLLDGAIFTANVVTDLFGGNVRVVDVVGILHAGDANVLLTIARNDVGAWRRPVQLGPNALPRDAVAGVVGAGVIVFAFRRVAGVARNDAATPLAGALSAEAGRAIIARRVGLCRTVTGIVRAVVRVVRRSVRAGGVFAEPIRIAEVLGAAIVVIAMRVRGARRAGIGSSPGRREAAGAKRRRESRERQQGARDMEPASNEGKAHRDEEASAARKKGRAPSFHRTAFAVKLP
jgi:hypothetical protein